MTRRQTFAVLAAVALIWAPIALHAQSAAEQAELNADATGAIGPAPAPSGLGGIVCPAGTSPTPIYFSDFETGDGGWTVGGAGDWERGTIVTGVFESCDTSPRPEPTAAPSGVNVWANNVDGCYLNQSPSAESLISQTFDFSGLTAPIQMDWMGWYEIFVTFDMAQVLVNGNLEFEVTTTTATPTFLAESISLDAYAGLGSVTIDFRLFSTTVVNRMGWYVDDVAITACVAADADVELTKTVNNASPAPGDSIVYSLTATNNGPGDATGVVVTDDLPLGLTYVSDDCGGTFVDPTFSWNIGALANGAAAVCNVTVMVDAQSGDLVNNAAVTADGNDPVPANNAASTSITVGQPVQEIPTLGTFGFALLILLLGVSAALVLRRRSRQA